jgi:hypothetical protein
MWRVPRRVCLRRHQDDAQAVGAGGGRGVVGRIFVPFAVSKP